MINKINIKDFAIIDDINIDSLTTSECSELLSKINGFTVAKPKEIYSYNWLQSPSGLASHYLKIGKCHYLTMLSHYLLKVYQLLLEIFVDKFLLRFELFYDKKEGLVLIEWVEYNR